jgi:hypothetical protein
MRKSMDLPPIHPALALPVAAVTTACGAISRLLAVDQVSGNTLVPLALAGTAIIATATFVYWYATDRERTRRQMAVQERLLKHICRESPDIDERHGEAKRLLIELDEAKGKHKS